MKTSTDRVPALLTPGEGVLNVGATRMLGKDMIDRLNRHGIKMMENGGIVPEPLGYQGGGIVPPMVYNPGVQPDYSGLSNLGSGLGALIGGFINRPNNQMSQNYAQAGSSAPVYGESGYPSAIPVGGYGPAVRPESTGFGQGGLGGGGLGGLNLTPQMIAQLIALWRSRQYGGGGY